MKNCIPSNVDKRTKLYKELERYQEYLYEKNLAENTITSYIGAVRQYYRQYRKITPQTVFYNYQRLFGYLHQKC